ASKIRGRTSAGIPQPLSLTVAMQIPFSARVATATCWLEGLPGWMAWAALTRRLRNTCDSSVARPDARGSSASSETTVARYFSSRSEEHTSELQSPYDLV